MKVKIYSFGYFKLALDMLGALLCVFLCIAVSFSFMLGAVTEGEFVLTSSESTSPLIVIDAGHGGEDVGAVGVNGVYEKDLNLQFALLLGEMLCEEGYNVFYTRTEDKLLYKEEENIKGIRKISDLKNRAAIVNEKMPVMFISIHMNYFSVEKYSGLEVYYRLGDSESQMLAHDISSEVKLSVDSENKRTPKGTEDLYLLKNTYCPAVLVECGFLSNGAECEKLCEKEYQKRLCFAIICGMIKYESRNVS